MSEMLPPFQLLQFSTVDEVVAAMQHDNCARLCAGGTDILVNMRRGLGEATTLIDITGIQELKEVASRGSNLFIGAGVTLRQIGENVAIGEHYPAVVDACLSIAAPSHREVATVGGNLCLDTRCLYYNQSHWWRKSNGYCLKYRGDVCHVAPNKKLCRAVFSGDLAPALMVHNAQLEIAGPDGRRRVALDAFYREDGANFLGLEVAEMIIGVHLPPSTGISGYRKIRIRDAIDFPLAGVAILCENSPASRGSFKVAITGTNSAPIMVDIGDKLGEHADAQKFFTSLAKSVQLSVSPLRTTTTPANYRRQAICALAKNLASELWHR